MSISDDQILLKEPEIGDLRPMLRELSSMWKDIGAELGVPKDVLDGLRGKGEARSDSEKLEDVLSDWIDSQCSDVTWQKIIDVLKKLRKNKQAGKMTAYLQEDKVKEKYRKKDDFKSFQ